METRLKSLSKIGFIQIRGFPLDQDVYSKMAAMKIFFQTLNLKIHLGRGGSPPTLFLRLQKMGVKC